MKIAAETIEELFVKSDQHEELLRFIDRIIQNTAPDLKRYLCSSPSITMIGYGTIPEEDWPLISLAPQKNSVNLYVAAEKDGVPLPQCYKDHFGKSAVGKSCIRIRTLKNADEQILKELVRETMLWEVLKKNKYGKI
jgi:hypothetical protein